MLPEVLEVTSGGAPSARTPARDGPARPAASLGGSRFILLRAIAASLAGTGAVPRRAAATEPASGACRRRLDDSAAMNCLPSRSDAIAAAAGRLLVRGSVDGCLTVTTDPSTCHALLLRSRGAYPRAPGCVRLIAATGAVPSSTTLTTGNARSDFNSTILSSY